MAVTVGLIIVASVPASAQCNSLRFRLWQPSGETWFEHGDFVQIPAGEEGHIYMHTPGKGSGHYSVRANIGYPDKMGQRGDASSVRRHLKMESQNNDDQRSGRIRLRSLEPGTTWLGYQVTGVKSPGELSAIAPRCRRGVIRIEVLSGSGSPGQTPDPAPGPGRIGAPEDLVSMLYDSILRRSRKSNDSQIFIDQVRRDVQAGSMEVAAQMVKSEEFRLEALRRTEQRHGRRGLGELRSLLLSDIYRDLYGFVEPSRDDASEDLRDLDECLSRDRNAEEACIRLGRNLTGSRLFYENHRELIEEVSGNSSRFDRSSTRRRWQ